MNAPSPIEKAKPSFLEQCEANIPDLDMLGDALFAQYEVKPYRKAKVLWLNHRWFLEQGVNSHDRDTQQDIITWLLESYAVGFPGEKQKSSDFFEATKPYKADRYGSTDGTQTGGSGRCGTQGKFNAKGIGRTPLTSRTVERYHRHGFLRLNSAIREAITSEVAIAELPYGGVPVVAIIDPGVKFQFAEEDPRKERCGIVVRPNFLRPAHFERSLYFGDAGTRNSAQYQDALRVRDAVTFVNNEPSVLARANIDFQNIEDAFVRFATQIGAGRAHRIWLTHFLTSNISIDGRVVDFDAVRSVPTWERAFFKSQNKSFGGELKSMQNALRSLKLYFSKYDAGNLVHYDVAALGQKLSAVMEQAFLEGCMAAFPLDHEDAPDLAAHYLQLLHHYFHCQQNSSYEVFWEKPSSQRPWLFDAFNAADATAGPLEASVSQELRQVLIRAVGDSPIHEDTALNGFSRWLKPRRELFTHHAIPRVDSAISRLGPTAERNRQLIQGFIDREIATARRTWALAPKGFDVQTARLEGGSVWLDGLWGQARSQASYFEGHIVGDHTCWSGRQIPIDALLDHGARLEGNRVAVTLPPEPARALFGAI